MFVSRGFVTAVSRGSSTLSRGGLSSTSTSFKSIGRTLDFSTDTEAASVSMGDGGARKSTNIVRDYFSLLGVQRRFQLDYKELHDSYRQLMTKHHPDMQKQRSQDVDDDGEIADASQITHAYHTLRKPHTRAKHLLDLVGRPMEEEGSNAAALVGPEFLMQVMEYREAIESIPGLDDGAGDGEAVAKLHEILDETHSNMEEILSQIDTAFQEDSLDKALELSAQLQYWNRIEETIQDKL